MLGTVHLHAYAGVPMLGTVSLHAYAGDDKTTSNKLQCLLTTEAMRSARCGSSVG